MNTNYATQHKSVLVHHSCPSAASYFIFTGLHYFILEIAFTSVSVLDAHLSDLLYLCTSFPNKRATLTGRDDEPQSDWRLGADGAVGHQHRQVLEEDTRKERSVRQRTVHRLLPWRPKFQTANLYNLSALATYWGWLWATTTPDVSSIPAELDEL